MDGLYENYPDPDSLIAEMSLGEAEAMVRGDKLASGMIPKLASCVRALDSGVSAAHIINGTVPHALLLEMLTDSGHGNHGGRPRFRPVPERLAGEQICRQTH